MMLVMERVNRYNRYSPKKAMRKEIGAGKNRSLDETFYMPKIVVEAGPEALDAFIEVFVHTVRKQNAKNLECVDLPRPELR